MKPRKRNDLYPITFTLKANGLPVDTTGYTVTINIVDRAGAHAVKVANGACVPVSAVNGQWKYTPNAADVDTSSAYDLEIKGIAPDGTPYHWPSSGYEALYIQDNLG